ncbi:MAG: hypothetical protein KDK70_38695 [Myxococcales bacterium]|nr:hypothetical protein [Myxococcales bacterium]
MLGLLSACTLSLGDGDGPSRGDFPIPDIPEVCDGFEAQDVAQPDADLRGDDCNEAAIRAAVEAGGTVRVECPDAPVIFTSQMVVTRDTVLDGAGVTVLDGGGSTRLLRKVPGPTLHVQNITLQNARAPQALGDAEVTQANWYEWAGGAILAQCHDTGTAVGGALYGKNLVCRDSATGSHTRDPDTGQILDTGTGGCVYAFACRFHCDECELTGNRATNGGAVGALGAKALLTHSACVGNEARRDASSNDNQGFGGCYYQDGTETAPGEDELNYVHLCGNYLADNHADASGGAVSLFYRQHTNTSFAFLRNTCEANTAGDGQERYQGGGCLYTYVDPETKISWAPDEGPDQFVVSSNAFLDNAGETIGGGAAIYNVWQTSTRFDNNLFLGNAVRTTDQSTGGGGALGLVGAFFDLEHNTFAFNTANNWVGGVALGDGGVGLRNNLFYENTAPVQQGSTAGSPSEHVNWSLDERDDGRDDGFLVFASGGNLFFPATTPWGEPRPTPGGAITDRDPELGELVRDDGFPYYLPLLPGSPAIDAGLELTTVEVDMRGQSRNGAPDIGAVEASE